MSEKYLLIYKTDTNVSGVDFDLLQLQEIDIIYATDKKTMIEMMRETEAGAVVAFYESEDKNTIDFLRYIMRQHPNTQRIYLTYELNKELIENIINKAHVNYLLTLPLELKTLESVIIKAFKRYQFLTQPSRRLHDLTGMTAQLLENVNKYRDEASTDALTNLFNRRSFDKILQKAVTLFNEQQLPFSLIMIDLDNFKQLNDTYGHSAGDEVLRFFGQILQKNMRQEDFAFRYGGEEFAVIASGDIAQNIKMFVNRIRVEFKNTQIKFEGREISVTFSAGVASMSKDFSQNDLIKAADAALYDAKSQGKDQIVIYEKNIL
jgi:diguanylate cyclase (GGDEF)-like protein